MDASYLDLVMAQQEEALEEAEGGGGVWVVADLADGEIAPVTLEAIGAARALADSLGAYVYGVLLGDDVTALAETAYHAGADGVRVAEHQGLSVFAVKPYVEILAELFDDEQPEIVLFGATEVGQALAPRLAQRMGGGLIEHVTAMALEGTSRAVEATLPVYGGDYFQIRTCPKARPQFLTVEPGAFSVPFLDEYRRGEPTVLDVEPVEPAVQVLGPAEGFKAPEVALSAAPAVVAAGRQAGDLALVERLAEALDAQLAGDRGAWDAGLIEADRIVDVRGVRISPEVYVAVGIRGDTFHNAAIEGSKFIVAIHPDPGAPIFALSDLCVADEPEEVLPALLDALE
ncbi:MAG: electron transfer flavoprotein subunit alpha/FixB family protein [Chloroflexota bacterium]